MTELIWLSLLELLLIQAYKFNEITVQPDASPSLVVYLHCYHVTLLK